MDGERTHPVLSLSDPDEDGICKVTIQRPEKANALNAELAHALLKSISSAANNGCSALLIEGAGRNFCAGFDFEGYETLSRGDIVDRFIAIEQALQQLRAAPFISVAVVQGAAFGAGADIAAACTYRIGSDRARFRFPGFQFGVALGTRHLADLVGLQCSREILLENRIVQADEALAIGLLTHREQEGSLIAKAQTLARSAASLESESVERILRLTSRSDPEADMADLVGSLNRPGLHNRIARYREQGSPG